MDFQKDSVHIREKKLSNGKRSLYLDIYSNGMRKYEFLKLYLVPEESRKSKQQNKETLHEAETLRIQKLAEITKHPFENNAGKTGLCWFIRHCMSMKTTGTASVYRNVLGLAEKFFGNDFVVENLTKDKIKEFFGFVGNAKNRNNPKKKLSTTTQHLYCSVFNTVLRHAADEGLVPYDISKRIKIVQKDENERQYLTVEEVQLLARQKLSYPYKKAFVFSCLTGLRESDIERLKWHDVVEQDGFTRIIFRQKKTKSMEYLDISAQACKIMGPRKDGSEMVFPRFKCTSLTNKRLRKWIKSVGIDKHITFHCARHTFAVMMLTIDTDIYTVSKLLGHKELSTTQIYAKIVDKKKQEAVTRIPIVI